MNAFCGNEIYSSLFDKGTVTPVCCFKLVAMDKPCRDAFIQDILNNRVIKGERSKILANGEQIWKDCYNISYGSSF